MTARLVGFDLALPQDWVVLPHVVPDVDRWARETAQSLVRRSGGAPAAADEAAGPGREALGRDALIDPAEALADGIAGVARTVAEAGVTGMEAAFLVRRPDLGRLDAMLTLVAQQGLSAEAFGADLERVVADGGENQLVATEVRGDVPAGAVRGLHLMIGHAVPDLGEGVAHLEERVSLGVFPPDSADMVEVTAIANGVGAFDDLPQAVLDLLTGLTIETEVAA